MRNAATKLLLAVALAATPVAAWADEINPDSCEEELGQGGVSVTSSEGTENVAIDTSATDGPIRIAITQQVLFTFLGVQLEGAILARELGFDPDEFLQKFADAPIAVQAAGFQAITLEDDLEGVGLLGTLAVLAFTDPVYAFDFTYRNTTGVEQTVEYQMPLNTDPTPFVNDTTPARSYLEVDLLDANGDGAAELGFAPGSAGGFLRTDVTIDNFDAAILIDDQGNGLFDLGEEILSPTTETQVFDTGLSALRTFASDPEFVTDIGPALRFTLSPGDEARFRGVISVGQSEGLVADPLMTLSLLDNGFISLIPEPTGGGLLLAGLASGFVARSRRR